MKTKKRIVRKKIPQIKLIEKEVEEQDTSPDIDIDDIIGDFKVTDVKGNNIYMRHLQTGRLRIATDYTNVVSRTKQEPAARIEINAVMKRFNQTGQLDHVSKVQPLYGDFSEVTDYSSTLQRFDQIQQAFSSLPADIRNRFDNNPEKIMRFLNDSKNLEEAQKLGLVKAKTTNQTTTQQNPDPKPPGSNSPNSTGDKP